MCARFFAEVRKLQDDSHIFVAIVVIALGEELSLHITAPKNWFLLLKEAMVGSKLFLRVCWLKAIGGGWTTSCRMHEDITWPCIFGCPANDEIRHYLICLILWSIACAQLSVEDSTFVKERLCLVQPTVEKLKRLALAHTIYHCCKFDAEVIALLTSLSLFRRLSLLGAVYRTWPMGTVALSSMWLPESSRISTGSP